jgi:hypothetical protein
MNTRVPMPMYTGSPFESSSIAGSRTDVLIREVRRRVVPRPTRGHATTGSLIQDAALSTSLREPGAHAHNDDDLDNGDKNPYPDFHGDPPSVGRPCLPATSRRANELHVCALCSRSSSTFVPRAGSVTPAVVTTGLGLIRKRNAAPTPENYPRRPRECRRREATVLRPPAFSLRSFHVGTRKRSRSSGSSKPMTAHVW